MLILIFVALVVIAMLQILVIITYWRQGNRYSRMESEYRRRLNQVRAVNAKTRQRAFDDWDIPGPG